MRVRHGQLFNISKVNRGNGPNGGDGNGGEGGLAPKIRADSRRRFQRFFSLGELKTICLDLGIEYENFPGVRNDFVRELIADKERSGHLPELVHRARQVRPHVDWPQVDD